MSECDEVAAAMLDMYFIWIEANNQFPVDQQTARDFVWTQMPDESVTIIDNVAYSLYRQSHK